MKAIKRFHAGQTEFNFQNQLVDGVVIEANLMTGYVLIAIPINEDKTKEELFKSMDQSDILKIQSVVQILESIKKNYTESGHGHYNIDEKCTDALDICYDLELLLKKKG